MTNFTNEQPYGGCVMTTTPELDRAIEVADRRGFPRYTQEQKRRHARALIRELFINLQPPADATDYERDLWIDTIAAVWRRAGLEGEG